jgi:hypothetical protein
MSRPITPQTSLDNLEKEAKRWLKELRAGDPGALERLKAVLPKVAPVPGLRDVQRALAIEHGLPGWAALKLAVEEAASSRAAVERYRRLADDLRLVYASADPEALARFNRHYGRMFTVDDVRATVWRQVYKVRQAKGAADAFGVEEARELVARTTGFSNWRALVEAAAKGQPSAVPAYDVDTGGNRISPHRDVSAGEWERILGAMREQRIPALEANGRMTDDVLARVAELDPVTSLGLSGCRGLTDAGVAHLARMARLEHLDLTGANVTDRGLEVLRSLPNLRTFKMCWQGGISDAGVSNLRFCDQLESVNVMGSPVGDGLIEALSGKPLLRRLETGRLVTDAGLALLRDFPRFRTWQGEQPAPPNDENDEPTHLLIDGPFSNAGLAKLAGLEGVHALDLFWHVSEVTTDAFAVLAELPNLASLGADGRLSDDVAMRRFAAIPRLRKLRAQESAATDEGFIALSRSPSLERFWGRECPNFTGRGFVALSRMPALRALGISCKNVGEDALAQLPSFPALRELTSIGITDEGFRQVGRCERLERLSCMYCRATTDVATERIAGLRLQSYYAGLTQITDRSLEILGGMDSLEAVELFETKGVGDAGLAFLARLPRLRKVSLSGLPLVTYAGTRVFPDRVRIEYDV